MATFTAIVVCVCTVEVDIPDSKLKSSSEETLDRIMDFAVLKFDNLSKDIVTEVGDLDTTVYDIKAVEKSDSNYENYSWNGEKLIKESNENI